MSPEQMQAAQGATLLSEAAGMLRRVRRLGLHDLVSLEMVHEVERVAQDAWRAAGVDEP